MIVVAGSAAVELFVHATLFIQENTSVSGNGKITEVTRTFVTHLVPPSCLKRRPVTRPPTKPQKAYVTIVAVRIAPRRVTGSISVSTNTKITTAVANICAPAPITAQKRLVCLGVRKTSPLMSFHPVSSSCNSSYGYSKSTITI